MTQKTLSDYQGYDCPECEDRSFDTPRGFNSHWGQVHGGDPPGDLDTTYGEHSKEHRKKLSKSLEGRSPSEETREKISDALSGRTHDPEFVEKRVAPQRERFEVECDNCGKTLHRHKCRVENYERQFCDGSCHGEWNSKNNVGSNHPRWRGGPNGLDALRRNLSDEWWRNIAAEVREEYNHTCQKCGLQTKDDERALEVHHIVPLIVGGTNHKDNLMPLCHACHRNVEEYTKQFTEPHLLKYANEEGEP